MKPEKISDAMNHIDETIIEEAEAVRSNRQKPKVIHYHNRKRIIVALIAAVLMLTGFAIAPRIITMLNGRTVEWDDNHLFTSGTTESLAEVRDGRVYFTLDHSDITEYCSETTYFRYDFTDEEGIDHIILIGGEPDYIGWTEILFFEDGRRFSHSSLQTENGDDPAWYVTGNAEVNKDYGYISQVDGGNKTSAAIAANSDENGEDTGYIVATKITFDAKILEVQENALLVEPLEGTPERELTESIAIGTETLGELNTVEYVKKAQAGDIVQIGYLKEDSDISRGIIAVYEIVPINTENTLNPTE